MGENCSGLLYSVSGQTSEGPKCDVCQLSPHKPPPWQPVVETNMTLCRIQSNLVPCDSLYTKTPSPLTHVIKTIITVHTPMSQEGIILCAWPVICICSVLHPLKPPITDAHVHSLLLLSPWIFLQSLTFVRPGRPGLYAERRRPCPPSTLQT